MIDFNKYKFQKRKLPVTHNVIDRIHGTNRNMLPQDYVQYAINYEEHELEIEEHIIILWDIEELLEINSDYQVQIYCPEIFLFGSNGGGEGIAFDFQKTAPPRIVLVPLIGMSRDNLIVIGNSFHDMFERLEKGEFWFN